MTVKRTAENTRMSVQHFFLVYDERKKLFLTIKKTMDILRQQHVTYQIR
jgi:hypothetical protein